MARADRLIAARPVLVLWLLGGVVLGVGAFLFAGYVMQIGRVMDATDSVVFADWWNASNTADRLVSGLPIYHADQLAGPYVSPRLTIEGFAYPPPAAVLFLPFRGTAVGLPLWMLVNVGLLVSGIVAIVRAELPTLAGPAALAAVGGLLAFPPFAVGLMWANVNLLLAGVLAWAWIDRARWTPVAAGMGGLIKIFPAAVGLWRIRADGWRRAILGLLAGSVGISLLTLPIVGIDAWPDFAVAMANSRPACSTAASLVCELQGPLGLAGARLIATALALLAVGLSVWVRPKTASYALLLVSLLIAAPDLHFHYWIMAYVVLVAVVSSALGRRMAASAGLVEGQRLDGGAEAEVAPEGD